MSVIAKLSHYRWVTVMFLITMVIGITATTYYRFPGWWNGMPANKTGKRPSAIALAMTKQGTNQSNDESDDRPDSANNVTDIFAVRTWEPPAPVLQPTPPPPPDAPLLPFKFIGRIADPQKGTAFLLTRGKELISVNVGDNIDGVYRVEKFENGQLYFLYQPLNIRQSLFVGSDS